MNFVFTYDLRWPIKNGETAKAALSLLLHMHIQLIEGNHDILLLKGCLCAV